MYTKTNPFILIFSGIFLLLFACNSQESPNSKVIRDSIYKEDSLFTVFIMEKLKEVHSDSSANDSNNTSSTRSVSDLFPVLTPESRKTAELAPTVDSCTDKVETKVVNLPALPGAKTPISPQTPTLPPKKAGDKKPKTLQNEPKSTQNVQNTISAPLPVSKPEASQPAATPQEPKQESPAPKKEEENK